MSRGERKFSLQVKKALNLFLTLGVTLVCMGWAFRGTNFHQQWESLRAVNYILLLPYLAILLTVHVARTLRWGCLLSGIERVPFKQLNEASAIGFMMLLALPFRLGEFARPFLIAQRSTIRRSPAMMTVVLERIVDGVTIAILLRLLLLFVHTDSPQIAHVKWGADLMFLVFASGLGFLLFGLWQQARAVWLIKVTAGRFSPELADKMAHVVGSFVGALRQLPKGGQLVAFFAYTLGYWALNGVGLWFLSLAFRCHSGGAACLPLEVTLFQGFVVLSVLVVGLMIPAAPGSMGTFQAAVRIGLSLFVPQATVISTGLAFANVLWLAQTAQQIILGLVFMSMSSMSFGEIAGKLQNEAA